MSSSSKPNAICTVAPISFRSRSSIGEGASVQPAAGSRPNKSCAVCRVVRRGCPGRCKENHAYAPSKAVTALGPPTALLWAGGVPGCSGCCGLTAPCPCGNHHCPRWHSHFQSDFSCCLSWVDGGRSPRHVAQPAVARLDCRAQEGIGGLVGACCRAAMVAFRCRSSEEVRCSRSEAMGVRRP